MISLHHVHLMANEIEATLTFWREHFGAVVVLDAEFAGARNVFLRVGEGRLHLYAQPPKRVGQGTVHHLGVETDELEALVNRLKAAGVSVTETMPCGGQFRDGAGARWTAARTVPARRREDRSAAGGCRVFLEHQERRDLMVGVGSPDSGR